MPADPRFVTRRFRPGDETAILDLFAQSFHAPADPRLFRWKYQGNPYDNGRISLTFDAEGALDAQYAGYPVLMHREGRDSVAHHIGDIMTRRSVRQVGRGLSSILGRTAMHFYENFCEGKVAFNYGFTTGTHQKLSVRFLRATVVEPVIVWRRRFPVPRISGWRRWLRGFQLELVRDFGAEYDAFFERVAPAYGFLVRRDARYLRWRYLQEPDGIFIVAIRRWRRLAGWGVFRIRERSLIWGDALFDPGEPRAVGTLIRHVAPSYPVDLLTGWFAPRPAWFTRALEELGMAADREPQELALTCVPFEMADATARMHENLYYTMGDSDLF